MSYKSVAELEPRSHQRLPLIKKNELLPTDFKPFSITLSLWEQELQRHPKLKIYFSRIIQIFMNIFKNLYVDLHREFRRCYCLFFFGPPFASFSQTVSSAVLPWFHLFNGFISLGLFGRFWFGCHEVFFSPPSFSSNYYEAFIPKTNNNLVLIDAFKRLLRTYVTKILITILPEKCQSLSSLQHK